MNKDKWYKVTQIVTIVETNCVLACDEEDAIEKAIAENKWDRLPLDENDFDYDAEECEQEYKELTDEDKDKYRTR